MHYRIECDDGWAALIHSLCELVFGHSQQGVHAVPAARQIKEKLGSLRVRLDSRCAFCDGASRMIAAYSERICEVSGKPGTLCVVKGHGMKTLSAGVAAKLGGKPVAQVDLMPMAVQASLPQGWRSLAAPITSLVPVTEFCVSGDQLNAKSEARDAWTLGVF
jgi:hypothetical protein